jgi:putative nucleotidyltransferase with HDIG domain
MGLNLSTLLKRLYSKGRKQNRQANIEQVRRVASIPASTQLISEKIKEKVEPSTSTSPSPTHTNSISSDTKINIDAITRIKLPPMPSSAMRVAKIARDINASSHIVANAIGHDPILTARILKAANSPLYSPENRITTLPVAVNTLGLQTIHQLAISYAASSLFNEKSKRSEVEELIWKHSIAVGIAARELSLAINNRANSDTAFICGLMHDIGKLLLRRHNPDKYSIVEELTSEQEILDKEIEFYGCTHAHVGSMVVRDWGLTEETSNVIYYHHDTNQIDIMVNIIKVADKLANSGGIGVQQDLILDLAADSSVLALGLSQEDLNIVWGKTQENLNEMMSLLE